MAKETSKILREYSLAPWGKQRLQAYFDLNFDALRSGDAEAQKHLEEALREVLPKQSQTGMKKMFTGKSPYAVLIHNLPEREGLENNQIPPDKSDSYSFHIANALYRMHELKPGASEELVRDEDTRAARGGTIHRDFQGWAGFAATYNGEHAPTEIIDMPKAIRDASPQMRKLQINELKRFYSDGERHAVRGTLQDVLPQLRKEKDGEGTFLLVLAAADKREDAKLEKILKPHSEMVDLQPGQLLLVNEHYIFHRGHMGHPELVENAAHTRIMVRTSGVSSEHLAPSR